jgi:hypothetical protein
MAGKELWRVGVRAKEQRPDGNIRFSQVISTFGPGALVDLVDDAAIVAGLSFWAKGTEIVEDRLIQMLNRQEGYERVRLYAPPPGGEDLETPDRRWIKAFRFPEWFACSNEKCWEDGGNTPRRDGAKPRRLLHISVLDAAGHKCKGGKGVASKVQPVRFVRACRLGHVDDLDWYRLVHRKGEDCRRFTPWIDEAGASGDLNDVRITCSGCGASIRMSLATQQFTEGGATLGMCSGKQIWLGGDSKTDCKEPMRFLLRTASHAYFPVNASVIHIPDAEALLRDKVGKVFDLLQGADDQGDIRFFRKKQEPIKNALEGFTDEAVWNEVQRRKDGKPVAHQKVKDAEIQVLLNPNAIKDDAQRFSGRILPLSKSRTGVMANVDKVVLLDRLVEIRALVGFTRFEPQTADKDGELDIGAEVVKPDDPLTWLPAIEHFGEGVFLSLKEDALSRWEQRAAVKMREDELNQGFEAWKDKRKDRAKAKPDFASARFVLLHSLSHLLITAVSLECGYSASSIRERIYSSSEGSGILLYTSSPGAEGSLGGLAEVGRHLERYLERALDLGRLCANDPVCAAHHPEHDPGGGDRHLEGASCHGCLLISEPSCERMNVYLDRTLVVPTIEITDAAFFGAF